MPTPVDLDTPFAHDITYRDALKAIAPVFLEEAGFNPAALFFDDDRVCRDLISHCPHLLSQLLESTPASVSDGSEPQAEHIAMMLQANLSDADRSELSKALQNVCVARLNSPPDFAEDTLEKLRAAIDDIEYHDDPTERQRAHQHAKKLIEETADRFYQASTLMGNLIMESRSLDTGGDERQRASENYHAQSAMLVEVERLATVLNRPDWAQRNGFKFPA